jgi:hypothetical protein
VVVRIAPVIRLPCCSSLELSCDYMSAIEKIPLQGVPVCLPSLLQLQSTLGET